MKKIVAVLLSAILCLAFVSCKGNENKVKKDEFKIHITNMTNENIKGINLYYSVAGKEAGNVYVGKGNDAEILNGESIVVTVLKEDFKDFESLLSFRADCDVINAQDKSVDSINAIRLDAEYGEMYYYMLDGTSLTGFHLSKLSQPIENN